jgi:ribonucleoside-diphosphate reductase alpha chain
MRFERKFTKEGVSPFDQFDYVLRTSVLRNPDGSEVFKMENVEVPVEWSQVATDILAQKYFRKTNVPLFDENNEPILDEEGNQKFGAETSIRQVVHRLAGAWRYWGEKFKYFDTEKDAQVFYDEISYMLLNQMAAPNSPQWFNTGLAWAYGITGSKQGHYYVDPENEELKKSEDAYTRPQPHACFIQSLRDDLVGEGGIFDLALREARIFKFGSGSGTNFSGLRGEKEPLSGGGVSSGLMSFLKVFDRAAGAIKSGGTTRRAAKMVIVDIDHPDIEKFIEWKAKEEEKVAALVSGSRVVSKFLNAILNEAVAHGTDSEKNPKLKLLIKRATRRGVPLNYIMRVITLAEQGYTNLKFEEFDTHYESEAYNTVSGQNSNNSVRVTNEFIDAVREDKLWELRWRTDSTMGKTVRARELWEKINLSAWKSADPGLQFDTTINEWHTCPNSGRINASNPCSEYMFLDDTACNLASLNLMKFYDEDSGRFLIDDYKHAIRLWTVVLEISVLMAQFPSKNMAQNSYNYRTLGLGYANLGTLLMVNGIPYDSPEALAMAGAITAILTGEAYHTSAEMAKELGAFKEYEKNKAEMLRVIRNHRRAAYNAPASKYEGLTIRPRGIDPKYCPQYLLKASKEVWDNALAEGEKYGYRNAQVTVLAPTGTIGLVMDCDTTGIEPDFAIVKFKKLAGGGYFKIVNQSVRKALLKLGYTESQIQDIENYSKGHGTLKGCQLLNSQILREKGFSNDIINKIESQLKTVFDIRFAFNKWTMGEELCQKLGFTKEQIDDNDFDILSNLGFSNEEIDAINDYVCGTMMIEGAPHLQEKHLPIFDTANKCGRKGKRFISYMGHVRMMSAAQPFISGAISKTVNMPAHATVDEIGKVYLESWEMMLKAISVYRDGSKLSQPLNSSNLKDIDEVVMLGDEDTIDETLGSKEVQEQIANRLSFKAQRRRLPKKRTGHIREAFVGGHKVYLRTGEYEDGSLGEIFIDMYKEGASFKGLLNTFAVLASKALQYGIPLEELVDSFTFTRFEPAGVVTGHEAIKNATSILDYVFRSLGYDYLGRTDFVHEKAVDEMTDINGKKLNGNKSEPEEKKIVKLEPEGPPQKKSIITMNNQSPKTDDLVEAEVTSNVKGNSNSLLGGNGSKPVMKAKEALRIGYTGEQCSSCGSIRVKRNGSCTVCEDCGATSGCS